MAKKQNNATCTVCGKNYYLCIACDRHKSTWRPWMVIVDDENCYNIYDIVSKYIAHDITKEQAKELLNTVDLTDLDNFRSLMKSKIKEILDLDVKIDEVKEAVEETVKETIEENKEFEMNEVVGITTTSKKKNSKKYN
jgi:hypothetical protein